MALEAGYRPNKYDQFSDDLETPYYGGAMNGELPSAQRFISILEKYKDLLDICQILLSDVKTYVRTCKKVYGMTPSAFRKAILSS